MQKTNTVVAAPSEPDDPNAKGQRKAGITPIEIAAVDELCNILARVLMRVQAAQESDNRKESGE